MTQAHLEMTRTYATRVFTWMMRHDVGANAFPLDPPLHSRPQLSGYQGGGGQEGGKGAIARAFCKCRRFVAAMLVHFTDEIQPFHVDVRLQLDGFHTGG